LNKPHLYTDEHLKRHQITDHHTTSGLMDYGTMAPAAADGVQESEEVSGAQAACIDDKVDEQLSAPLVAMSHDVTVSSSDTLTSIPNSESAGTTESSSAAVV
jgi:hypothetical protein